MSKSIIAILLDHISLVLVFLGTFFFYSALFFLLVDQLFLLLDYPLHSEGLASLNFKLWNEFCKGSLEFTDLGLCLGKLLKTLLELLNHGENIESLLCEQRSKGLNQDQIGCRGHIVVTAHFLQVTNSELLYTNLHVDANGSDTSSVR